MADAFFNIEMLSAHHGDALWVEYGKGEKLSRILIDGGPIGAFEALDARMSKIPKRIDREFDLVVVSHVDTDHVDGLVRLLAEKPLRFSTAEVWFNGWRHLIEGDKDKKLGGLQGEFFSALIQHRLGETKWNKWTKGRAIVVEAEGELPSYTLKGGMKLTLLSPSRAKLKNLQSNWKEHIAESKLKPGDLDNALTVLAKTKRYLPGEQLALGKDTLGKLAAAQSKPDAAVANGSSIAFLAEYGGKSCLFLADAHTDLVIESLRRLLNERQAKRLKVDAVKIAHHGSKGNTNAELLELIDSKYFLISTNGAQFKHPDREPIELIINGALPRRPVLRFNYRTKFNERWFDVDVQKDARFKAVDATLSPVLTL